MADKRERRAFRFLVWGSRAIGWILVALAVASPLPTWEFAHISTSFRLLLSSLALGLVGIGWIVGLEVFLKFFDKFLSQN
jgi:hypothetical protein